MYQLLCSLKCVLGYEFAGLRGSRCHCGNDPNKYSEQSREDCNVTCNSDSELTCGGKLRSIVSIHMQHITSGN